MITKILWLWSQHSHTRARFLKQTVSLSVNTSLLGTDKPKVSFERARFQSSAVLDVSSLITTASIPFSVACSALKDKFNVLITRKDDLITWSRSSAFNGLITITSFFNPPKTAKPSKIKLLPYPVPAQKMLSYPCNIRRIRWTCHSSGVYESLSTEMRRVRIASRDKLSGSLDLMPWSRWLAFPFRFLGVSGSMDELLGVLECREGVWGWEMVWWSDEVCPATRSIKFTVDYLVCSLKLHICKILHVPETGKDIREHLEGVWGSGMVGWVSAMARNGFVELIAHPKTRSVPINLGILVIIHPRS